MNAKEIICALNNPPRVYPREAIQAAIEQKDEVVPLLLGHLEKVLEHPEQYGESMEESLLPIYAVYLLSYHRVRKAHVLLIELASLHGEKPDDLFSDAVTEEFPKALWNTCGGDPTDIIRLINNREANEYCRSSAIQALTYGVAVKALPRKEAVEFLQGLLADEDSAMTEEMIWYAAVSGLARLWPGESMDILRKVYEEELVDSLFIGLEDIEFYLEQGKAARLSAFQQEVQRELNRTPHDEIQFWACFNS